MISCVCVLDCWCQREIRWNITSWGKGSWNPTIYKVSKHHPRWLALGFLNHQRCLHSWVRFLNTLDVEPTRRWLTTWRYDRHVCFWRRWIHGCLTQYLHHAAPCVWLELRHTHLFAIRPGSRWFYFRISTNFANFKTATKQQTDDHTSLPVTTDVCYDCTTNKRKSTKIQKKKNNPTSWISYHGFTILVLVLCLFFSPILSPSHTESPCMSPAIQPAFTCTFHVCRRFAQSSLGKTHEVRQVFYLFDEVRRHWRWRWTGWWICQYAQDWNIL